MAHNVDRCDNFVDENGGENISILQSEIDSNDPLSVIMAENEFDKKMEAENRQASFPRNK